MIWSPDLLDQGKGARRSVAFALQGAIMARIRDIAPKKHGSLSLTIGRLLQAAIDDPEVETMFPIMPEGAEITMKRRVTHEARVMMEPEQIATIERWVKRGYSWVYVTTVLLRRGLDIFESVLKVPTRTPKVVKPPEPEPEPDPPAEPVVTEAVAVDDAAWDSHALCGWGCGVEALTMSEPEIEPVVIEPGEVYDSYASAVDSLASFHEPAPEPALEVSCAGCGHATGHYPGCTAAAKAARDAR